MNNSKPWIRFLVSCCIAFSFLVGKEVRAQSDAQGPEILPLAKAAAGCTSRYGELSERAAECILHQASPTDLETCFANTGASGSASEGCFGLHPVQVGWLRMMRDLRLIHRDPAAIARNTHPWLTAPSALASAETGPGYAGSEPSSH